MADEGGFADIQCVHETRDVAGLGADGVVALAGPLGVAEAFDVEGDDVVIAHGVRDEVTIAVGLAAIAVDKDNRGAVALLEVMHADAIHGDDAARSVASALDVLAGTEQCRKGTDRGAEWI